MRVYSTPHAVYKQVNINTTLRHLGVIAWTPLTISRMLRSVAKFTLESSLRCVSYHRDVRAAVDLCHRDGSLKQTVAADPGRFMHEDPRLAPTLESLRASGRKVFLATNSLWDYTHVVMNFLL